ncbi:MAG TPA: long-chain-acyl-CoA synthetase [Chitinophagales bacterium]|nr:long-chain-acyl-CoA synthetase [Chitinophagales bacterium]HMW94638.1 long-chain-acyl-CoA synthetase [Chitinophagales bacterium]HMZ68521.1 long-chain-acyl-CoA synthetase [Chitinophagales bacterium]HNC63529.1 long-chain-acyl-CoA synthetase [Chitinophagales bacterium]HNE87437.1 long-chain-acyl-CoA synthetase [Chitinophagales bacterium]
MSKSEARKKQIGLFEIIGKVPSVIKDLPKIGKAAFYNFTTNVDSEVSIGAIFEETVQKFPEQICVYYLDRKWTYQEFDEWCNRLANHFVAIGIKKGDVVAVLLENRPELLAVSMALSKIGGIAALLNTAQRNKPLIHSIQLAQPKLLLIDQNLINNYNEIKNTLNFPNNLVFSIADELKRTSSQLKIFDIKSFQYSNQKPNYQPKIFAKDPAMYIYTSGTTGLPKASIISHGRWLKGYSAFGLTSLRLNEKDILYVPLPFFHATAMVVCWSSVVAGGAAIVIKNKFSVSDFWKDIHKYQVTGFGYVGEMCKYLLNTPENPLEKNSTLKKMIGNGLRPDIWQKFKQRFNIEQVAEFYASSEGNIAFFNVFNLDQTMGFSITSYAIVKYDIEKGAPKLDKNGFMQKVKTNGVGLLIGEINERYPYDGYTEKSKTEQTILRNVFTKGDAWFNTNDLVRDMGFGHTQFVDRLGDTFRWKGENVSTQEVEGIINLIDNVEESIVFGVEIPGCNGRAGMAKIILKENKALDMDNLYRLLSNELPAYAVPIFVRIARDAAITSTFKHQKSELKKEGFDINIIKDDVYVLKNKQYILLDKDFHEEICKGDIRF